MNENTKTKKKFMSSEAFSRAFSSIMKMLMGLAAIALIYSFLWVPNDVRSDRQACHLEAQTVAQQISTQVAQQNQQLGEGQQPVSVNEIGLYDTQYSLCLRSKGL